MRCWSSWLGGTAKIEFSALLYREGHGRSNFNFRFFRLEMFEINESTAISVRMLSNMTRFQSKSDAFDIGNALIASRRGSICAICWSAFRRGNGTTAIAPSVEAGHTWLSPLQMRNMPTFRHLKSQRISREEETGIFLFM